MLLTHKRNGNLISQFKVQNAIKVRQLMSINLLKFEVEYDRDIQAGDEIIANNNSYFVSLLQENQNNGRQMNVEARGTEYFLQNVLILSETKNDVFNYADITLNEIFTGSVYRTSIDNYTDFTIHFNYVPSEILNSIKTLEFNEDNVYSATQKICEVWNVEFLVDGYDIYFKEKVGNLSPVKTLVANQNTDVIQRNIDTSNVVTRIYPKGSTENLPPNYNYSNGLRPTIFDIASGVHTTDTGLTPPRNYYYDSDNIDLTNRIEKMVTFDNVKVHLRKGNADLFVDELDENSNPLKAHIITKNSISDIDLTRCKTEDKDGNLQYYITLYLEGGLYNITGARITNIDKANSRIDFIFPDDQDVSSFQTELDNYVFILENYLSNKEINEASEELANKALDHLELNKYPKVVYTLSGAFSVDQTEMFDVGDYIRIQDDTLRSFSEFEEEDIRQGLKVRVQKYEFDVDKGIYTSLEVSNKPLEIPYNIVKTQKELKEKIKEQTVELNNSAIKAYKAEQRLNRLLNHHFYGSPEEYLKIGAEDRNYSLYGLEFGPNSDDSLNRITTTLSVFALNKDPLVTVNIQGRTDLELTPYPGTFYMYIRIEKGTSGIMGFNTKSLNNTIMYYNVNDGKIESEDDNYYYFLLGLVTTYSDKKKTIDTSYGFTYIDGNRLYTGTVYADEIRVGSVLEGEAANWSKAKTAVDNWTNDETNFTGIKGGVITTGLIQDSGGNSFFNLDSGSVGLGKETSDSYLRFSATNGLDMVGSSISIRDSETTLKNVISAEGIRQIYNISQIDQIDSNYSLEIPIYIPKNVSTGTSSSGKAKIIVKAEKFRASAKSASDGGSSTGVSVNVSVSLSEDTVWDTIGSNVVTGTESYVSEDVISPNSFISEPYSHSHSVGVSVAQHNGHNHNIIASIVTDDGSHSHSLSISDHPKHTHTITSAIVTDDGSHTHGISVDSDSHSHGDTLSVSSVGDHGHTYSFTINDSDSHSHSVQTYTGTTGTSSASVSIRDSVFSSTSNAGGHGHSLTGGVSSDSHNHTASSNSTGSSHSHSVSSAASDQSKMSHSGSVNTGGSHNHNISIAQTDVELDHSTSVTELEDTHEHTIKINKHRHSFDKNSLSHTHGVTIDSASGSVNLPDHTHQLNFGIFENQNTATVTIKKDDGTTTETLGTTTTGSVFDENDISIENGSLIKIEADNLVRVQVYIFVEYYLA